MPQFLLKMLVRLTATARHSQCAVVALKSACALAVTLMLRPLRATCTKSKVGLHSAQLQAGAISCKARLQADGLRFTQGGNEEGEQTSPPA